MGRKAQYMVTSLPENNKKLLVLKRNYISFLIENPGDFCMLILIIKIFLTHED